jgi:hypothetical protein
MQLQKIVYALASMLVTSMALAIPVLPKSELSHMVDAPYLLTFLQGQEPPADDGENAWIAECGTSCRGALLK